MLQQLTYIVNLGIEFLDVELGVASLSISHYNGLKILTNPLHYITRIGLQGLTGFLQGFSKMDPVFPKHSPPPNQVSVLGHFRLTSARLSCKSVHCCLALVFFATTFFFLEYGLVDRILRFCILEGYIPQCRVLYMWTKN